MTCVLSLVFRTFKTLIKYSIILYSSVQFYLYLRHQMYALVVNCHHLSSLVIKCLHFNNAGISRISEYITDFIIELMTELEGEISMIVENERGTDTFIDPPPFII